VALFYGNNIVIKSLKKLKSNEQVKISYIGMIIILILIKKEIAEKTKERKKELKERYKFECECKTCQNEINENLMNGIKCKKCKKLLKEYECYECKLNINDINDDLNKINELFNNQNYLESFKLQINYYVNENIIFLETCKFLLDYSIINNDFKNSLYFCNLTIVPFECFFFFF
jgi:transcription-repair coupling factor (superfamily II helicase)